MSGHSSVRNITFHICSKLFNVWRQVSALLAGCGGHPVLVQIITQMELTLVCYPSKGMG